jgi:heme oxygenase (mycobilin-producing)
MNADAVVLINAFEVPEGEDEQFLEAWERSRAYLSAQPGYISTRLHRCVAPTADFRFVNVALWESAEAFGAATSSPALRSAPMPYPFHAALYEVVREDDR